ncbi:hypothetical protein [Fretibacterium sp. OH1220_COT-178]|uniref:hypothetical protein n=1 Tax=Fretibacterium sp. OH1220_COT-178 TaxID=2491047 RepID=UPI000F5D7427|nr:hypothetical protein [Fretibacterium sp. OH1220_COT-178]RRD63935.1 hypothetical protein EII26_09125 [Fretibacterium sp. OH1220_COT-178]
MPNPLDNLKLAGVTLKVKAGHAIKAKAIEVSSGNAVIETVADAADFAFETTNTIKIADATSLTVKGHGLTGANADLVLEGKGKLILEKDVLVADGLQIDHGGTLELKLGKLPAFAGSGSPHRTITWGSIILGTANAFHDNLTSLNITKGDLTLNATQKAGLKEIGILNTGTLTIKDGIQIGNGTDGTISLGGTATLDLKGDITVKGLNAPNYSIRVKIASGKTLSVKADADQTIGATVEGGGELVFDFSAGTANRKATLQKSVDGKVTFKGASAHTHTLALADGVTVKTLVFDRGTANDAKAKWEASDAVVGTLDIESSTGDGVSVSIPAGKTLKVSSLNLKAGAGKPKLKVTGPGTLEVEDGAGLAAGWHLGLDGNATLAVKKASVLAGSQATLAVASLDMVCGTYGTTELTITDNATLKVPSVPSVATPLLTVKKVDVDASHTLKFARPTTWPNPLKAGDKVTLLKITDAVDLHTTGKIVGDPADDAEAKVEEINDGNGLKELVLTAKIDLVQPDLIAPAVLKAVPGSTYNGTVLASGDVDPSTWSVSVVSQDPAGVIASSDLELVSKQAKSAVVSLDVKSTFRSATLKVRAKSATNTLYGEVEFTLTSGSADITPPPGPAEPRIDNAGWTAEIVSEDKLGNMTLKLRTRLFYDGLPKAVSADVIGMPAPKCELLDGAGRRVLAVEAAALKSYTLVLTCNVTRAQVAAGAAVKEVLVTKADGTVKTLPVNKKVKDMPRKPGDSGPNIPDPDGRGRSGGGGGCDAGLGVLALALAAAFLRRKV